MTESMWHDVNDFVTRWSIFAKTHGHNGNSASLVLLHRQTKTLIDHQRPLGFGLATVRVICMRLYRAAPKIRQIMNSDWRCCLSTLRLISFNLTPTMSHWFNDRFGCLTPRNGMNLLSAPVYCCHVVFIQGAVDFRTHRPIRNVLHVSFGDTLSQR